MTLPREIDCEFHCHTSSSHDGFTSCEDLIEECRKKNIGVVTITEHDVLEITEAEEKKFADAGIQLIPGCEMTSDTGAHIIGLFIITALSNKPVPEIVDHILRQNGLVYIPHPFKPDSGLLWTQPADNHENRYVMSKAHFIELYNGGWNSRDYQQQIRQLAQEFDMRLVAGSDSHKAWQVGYYKNRLSVPELPLDVRNLTAAPIELMALDVPAATSKNKPCKNTQSIVKKIQGKKFYQKFICKVPFSLKRKIKEINYSRQLNKYKQKNQQYTYISLR